MVAPLPRHRRRRADHRAGRAGDRRWRRRRVGASPWWALATLAWVIAQGAFGALTVTMKLYPAIVTLHLLGGLGLLVLLALQDQAFAPRRLRCRPACAAASGLVAGLRSLQVALGGWVSTNYAVLACSEFPTCQGRWWPPMDFGARLHARRAARPRWRRRLPAVRGPDRDPHDASPRRPGPAAGAAAAGLAPDRPPRGGCAGRGRFALLGIAALADWPAGSATSCSAGRWSRPWRTPAARRRWWWC